ncbi:nuclear transport factor 2 family protein [Candidatus Gottesmanbacteria bacterium]|nr:nuclear transport factor 2 family protein [Candidatus Gottesmanbacteria bacterium]
MTKKEIAISFLNLIISGKIREAYEKYVSPVFRHHNPYFKGDRESLLIGMEEAEEQFPDKVFEIQRALEDENLVAVHSKLRLKPDMPEMATVHIVLFEGDRIVEMWDIGQESPKEILNENGMF